MQDESISSIDGSITTRGDNDYISTTMLEQRDDVLSAGIPSLMTPITGILCRFCNEVCTLVAMLLDCV